MSRYVDMTTLFNFKNPKHVLSRVIARYLSDRGIEPMEGEGRLETR